MLSCNIYLYIPARPKCFGLLNWWTCETGVGQSWLNIKKKKQPDGRLMAFSDISPQLNSFQDVIWWFKRTVWRVIVSLFHVGKNVAAPEASLSGKGVVFVRQKTFKHTWFPAIKEPFSFFFFFLELKPLECHGLSPAAISWLSSSLSTLITCLLTQKLSKTIHTSTRTHALIRKPLAAACVISSEFKIRRLATNSALIFKEQPFFVHKGGHFMLY